MQPNPYTGLGFLRDATEPAPFQPLSTVQQNPFRTTINTVPQLSTQIPPIPQIPTMPQSTLYPRVPIWQIPQLQLIEDYRNFGPANVK